MTGRPDPDADLIARHLAGDRDAFDRLLTAHQTRVFAVCLRILGDREKALDATQETFITVLRKLDTFQGRSAFSTWLYRIAVNACYDLLRKEGRRPTSPLSETHQPPDPAALRELESAEVRPAIERALAELPAEYAAVVALSDLEDLPLHEVAEALQLPLGTVKSRLFRGRKRLAQDLQNLLGGAGRQKDEAHA